MNTQTHPIVLAGVDGSSHSIAAAEMASDEAMRRHQPLHLVSCVPPRLVFAPPAVSPNGVREDRSRPQQEMLDRVADQIRARHPSLDVWTQVLNAPPAEALVAESPRASLLVVGSRGTGGFDGMLAGSVATQVATHASCPVIVLQPGVDRSVERATSHPVVVGVDRGDQSSATIGFAFEEAAERGVSLTAIHVWAEPPNTGPSPFKPVAYDYDEAHREATRFLAEVLAGYQEKYPDVEVFREAVCSMNPVRVLLSVSAEAGLVVVGSRGYGGFGALLLGSVGQALIHYASCPVAIVRGLR